LDGHPRSELDAARGMLETRVVEHVCADLIEVQNLASRPGRGAQPCLCHDLTDQRIETLRFALDSREIRLRRSVRSPLSESESHPHTSER
jgi:hypothetical protein